MEQLNISISTRDKLIETAAPLFAQKGFAGVSIREIAQAADMNSALISYHFGGKMGLYSSILESEFGRIREMVARIEEENQNPVEFLRHYGKELSRLHIKRPHLLRLLHGEMINPTDCMERVIKKNLTVIAGIIAGKIGQGIEQGIFRQDIVPILAALSLAGMINFYFIVAPLAEMVGRELLGEIRESTVELYIGQALDMFIRGISLDSPRSNL